MGDDFAAALGDALARRSLWGTVFRARCVSFLLKPSVFCTDCIILGWGGGRGGAGVGRGGGGETVVGHGLGASKPLTCRYTRPSQTHRLHLSGLSHHLLAINPAFFSSRAWIVHAHSKSQQGVHHTEHRSILLRSCGRIRNAISFQEWSIDETLMQNAKVLRRCASYNKDIC